MKTSCVFILVFLVSTVTSGQTEKGNFMLGGTLGFSHNENSGGTNTSFSLAPNISYFLIDRLAVGLVTPYTNGKSAIASFRESKSWSYSVGPTVRYYFKAGHFAFFPDLSYSWGWSSFNATSDPSIGIPDLASSNSHSLLKAGGGVTYFANKNVGVEGVLFYQEYQGSASGGAVPAGLGLSSTLTFRIGLQIYLNPKDK